MGTAFAVYSIFILSGVAIGYVTLIVMEVNYSNRFASDVRLALDQKLFDILQRFRRYLRGLIRMYEKGSDAVESDLIDPIADPIAETKGKYQILKTGRMHIKNRPVTKISPYLRKLLERKNAKKK